MDKEILKMIDYSPNGIISKEVYRSEQMSVDLFCMARGTQMSEHTSAKQGLIYVLEGDGIFNLEGKDIPMLPGTFIYMNKNALHSLKSRENTSFLLTLIK